MSKNEVNFSDQLKKFAVKSILGFQTVLVFGLGRRLGIFDYLMEKGSEESLEVSFTLDEISQEIRLDPVYLDAWVHMAITCGLFERDDSCDHCIKTSPYIFHLLVDRKNMFYIGDILGGFYHMAPYQNIFLENFKTGKRMDYFDLPYEVRIDGTKMSAVLGKKVIEIFSNSCEGHDRILKEGGHFLEIGCGYGFNLKNWVEKYPQTRFVGIDIDNQAIDHTNQLITENNLQQRVQVMNIELGKFARQNDKKFNVILLNQVLHEMETEGEYRKNVFADIFELLKDEGILIVGESMIPGIFAPKQARYFEIMHKWFEVGIGSQFYDEESFMQFIKSTPFKKAEIIYDDRDYIWAISKER